MKKIAVAVALAMGVVGTANAGFYCSVRNGACDNVAALSKAEQDKCQSRTGNNYANAQYLEWHWGQTFPDTAPFNYEQLDVVCFVDAGILYEAIPQIGGLKKVPLLSNGPTQGPGSGAKVGLVYRGDDARFLIDNLRSIPGSVGGLPNAATPVTRTGFFTQFEP